MNLANKLTLLRVALIPVFLIILYLDFYGCQWVALVIFCAASFTDYVDGHIARSRNMVTDFGKFMDPLADKVLVLAAMLWFVEQGVMPAWSVIIVITRELAVTALRLIAVDNGRVIAAAKSGKIKTAATMVGIIIMFISTTQWINWLCIAAIVITTVYSGMEYFIKNKDVLSWTK